MHPDTKKTLRGKQALVDTIVLALPPAAFACHGPETRTASGSGLAGKRKVEVTERRTKKDYAECLRKISDQMYPDAERIVLVQDNLNTHTPASLYEAFEPAEAKRLADRFELHYTPKHGSWLDMAEIELGILSRQCLSRRIDNTDDLRREVNAWEVARNASGAKVNWRFRTEDARIKLKKLYPSIDE